MAKALGLGYPGGPIIDRLFNSNYKKEFQFKCGKIGFDLSFSGIKTALIYKKLDLEKRGLLNRSVTIKMISSFQEAIVDILVATVLEATTKYRIKTVVCGGGVIANRYLRQRLYDAESQGIRFFISPSQYATDNAAMVAGLGFYLYNKKGVRSSLMLKAEAN